jgi:hypothetical protein
MKVSQLALAAAMVAVLTCSASAQGPGGGSYPAGYPGAQGYSMQGNPGMQGGYPGMPQGGYPMMQQGGYPGGQAAYMQAQGDPAQEQLYGPQPGAQGGPMPMDGGQCGNGECGQGAAGANCYDDGLTHYAYFDAELFYGRRINGLVSQPVVLSTANLGTLASTTSMPEFRYEPGVKSTVGYMFPQAFAIEGTFWGQNYWSSHQTETGTADLTIPGALGGALLDLGTDGTTAPLVGTSQITATYTSRFDSSELNFVRPYANIQFLAGFRYIELSDKYDLNGASSPTSASDYLIAAHNHLYGGQLGVRGQWQIGRVDFDVQTKAGIYANSAGQHQTVHDEANTIPIRDASASNTDVAFCGDVSAYLTVPVYSFLTARFGYSACWITNLALAPNQLDFSDTATSGTTLNTHEGITIHCFDAGVEARW